MTTLGLDYAGGRPGGAAISKAGYRFVVRYLTKGGPGLPGKLLTPDEFQDLMDHNIGVVLNWETTADRMLVGRAAGTADAKTALATARFLGVPDNRPIYFSADWDASPTQQYLIDAYLEACAEIIGFSRVGVYGSYYVCQRCLDNRTARWAWQTGAWSGGNRELRAHLYQRIGTVTVGGVPCDVNEALTQDFGQHPTPTLTTAGPLEDTVPWKLTRTPVPDGHKIGELPDKTWPAVEDVISYPGPTAGWRGRILTHTVFGYGGGYIHEAWSGPSGKHFVTTDEAPGGGLPVEQFTSQAWETAPGDRYLTIRYSAPTGGSVGIEVEH